MAQGRRFSALVWVAILVPLATAVVVIPSSISASRDSSAARRSDELRICNLSYNADIDAAELHEDRARERREDAFADGLIAATNGDEATTAEAVKRIETAAADIAAAIEERSAAIDVRDEALDLARSNPSAFLAECRRRGR